MGSVWKRLQRVNKRAAKFQFTSSYHELRVETTAKWRPTNLSVVWTRRSRRVSTTPLAWEPDMMNPLIGHISWPVPDNHAISVTLFKDPRTHELEDKDWTFVIEDISHLGKKRILASASINMRKYASIESTQQSFTLSLKPVSRKITSADLELTISCVFLREGKATDEDMQSVISMMSVNNNCDVAPLDDLEGIPDLEDSGDISEHVLDFTQQLEQLTSSLNGGVDLATPMSVPSLSEDPTPLAEHNHLDFELELDKPNCNSPETHLSNNKVPNLTADNNYQNQQQLTPVNQKSKDDVDRIIANSNIERKTFDMFKKVEPKINDKEKLINNDIVNNKTQRLTNINDMINKKTENIYRDEMKNKIVKNDNIKEIKSSIDKVTKVELIKTPTDMIKTKKFIENTELLDQKLNDEKIEIIVEEEKDNKSNIQINIISNDNLENLDQSMENRDTKRSELIPLNLKKSYDLTTNLNDKNIMVDKISLKDRTPGQDLLEWCKEVTKDYPNIKVTNLTTSWRNGMAFCAIIHHFEPTLMDMTKLTQHDVVGNCRMAFDVAESLGIPRVIEPRDMSLLAVPDKLAVMTYLHQLRAHFTGKQLQLEQIGQTSDESSYVIGNYKTDNLSSQNVLNLTHLKAHLQKIDGNEENCDQYSPTSKKDVKNLILSGSKNLLVKVLSPTKEKNNINALQQQNSRNSGVINNQANNNQMEIKEKPMLMTRRELVDPFGSDEEDEHKFGDCVKDPSSPQPTLDPAKTNQLITRHREMSEKAKAMMEKLKSTQQENCKNDMDEERQQRLREHARRLIAETRLKSNSLDSPTSPIKTSVNQRITLSPERTISPIHHNEGFLFNNKGAQNSPTKITTTSSSPQISPIKRNVTPPLRDSQQLNNKTTILSIEDSTKLSPSHKFNNGNSPLQSFSSILDRISPKNEKRRDKLSYIESELEALEREQEAIDEKASSLEKKLRAVMGGNGGNTKDEETEEQLLSQWFTLVNKKNALLRRQMQLNILEQENDLERKFDLLNQELRAALSVEDWRKSESQRKREELLLEELVVVVNKRDQLVQHLHSQEKAIEDDDEIERELENVDISSKDKCIIQ